MTRLRQLSAGQKKQVDDLSALYPRVKAAKWVRLGGGYRYVWSTWTARFEYRAKERNH